MSSFALDIARAVRAIDENVTEVVQGTLFSLFSNVIQGTPVGNPKLWLYNRGTKEVPDYVDYLAYRDAPEGYIGGTLRGAWNTSITAPDETITNAKAPESTEKLTAAISTLELGETMFFTNPQPYAVRVEDGWSGQRPQGMVKVAVSQLKLHLKEAEAKQDSK